MLYTLIRTRDIRDVCHQFEVDCLEWEGLCINAAVEISATVSERYRTDEDGWTRDVKVYAEILVAFQIHDDHGDFVSDAATRLIRAKYEAAIIEAVKASIGDVDIEHTLTELYAD